MLVAFEILGAFFGFVVYGVCIYKGFRLKTCVMPFIPLALNVSWEFVWGVKGFSSMIGHMMWINVLWVLADVVILITWFLYGQNKWANLSRKTFIMYSLFWIFVAFCVNISFVLSFDVWRGMMYSAFLLNVIISSCFIHELIVEKRNYGLVIAVSKFLGTFFQTCFGATFVFVRIIGGVIALLDVVYIILVLKDNKKRYNWKELIENA